MRIEKNLKKGIEYTLSWVKITASGEIISLPKLPQYPGFLWDAEEEMLHFCIENDKYEEARSIKLFGKISGAEEDEVDPLITLYNVSLVPGNNLFQISLNGYLFKNVPTEKEGGYDGGGNEIRTIVNSIEKATTLENIPERRKYIAEYLNSLDGNPLGAFNKVGERIYQKHIEKLVESINLKISDYIRYYKHSIGIKGTYTYRYWNVENGETEDSGKTDTGKLEEINYKLQLISAPPGTTLEAGYLTIPENDNADSERIISGKIIIDDFEKDFSIIQEKAPLSYNVDYDTEFKKDNLPIFVISSGNYARITIEANVDPKTLVHWGPNNLDYFETTITYPNTNTAQITIEASEINTTRTYRPSEPFLYQVFTKSGTKIAEFYIVQSAEETNLPISIYNGDGQELIDQIVANKDNEIVVGWGATTLGDRYWTTYENGMYVGKIYKNGELVKEGVCCPKAAGVNVQQYIYKINVSAPPVENDAVVGSLTFWSPNTTRSTQNATWEEYALSDTKEIPILVKKTPDSIVCPDTIRATYGIREYTFTIVSNRTLTLVCEFGGGRFQDSFSIDGSTTKILRPRGYELTSTFALTLRYSGPTALSKLSIGTIEVYRGESKEKGIKIKTISVESLPLATAAFNINLLSRSGLELKTNSSGDKVYLLEKTGGSWNMNLSSIPLIAGINEINWLDPQNPVQIIKGVVSNNTSSEMTKSIKIFNPYIFNTNTKILNYPIYIAQKGNPPMIMESGNTEMTYKLVNLSYSYDQSNSTVYYYNVNPLDPHSPETGQISFNFYSRYPIGTNDIKIYVYGVEGNKSLYTGIYNINSTKVSAGRYSCNLLIYSSIAMRSVGVYTESDYRRVAEVEITSKQTWNDKITIEEKKATVDFRGGIPEPIVVGDTTIYAGCIRDGVEEERVYKLRLENMDGWRINGMTRTPVPQREGSELEEYQGYITTYNIGTNHEIIITAGKVFSSSSGSVYADISENSAYKNWCRLYQSYWRLVGGVPTRIESASTGNIENYCEEELDLELNSTGSGAVETKNLQIPIIKRAAPGHIEIDGVKYGPGDIYNKNVDWSSTIENVNYSVVKYDEGFDITDYYGTTTTESNNVTLAFNQNYTEDSILHQIPIDEPIGSWADLGVTQGAFSFTWDSWSNKNTIISPAKESSEVFSVTTDLVPGQFIIKREANTNPNDWPDVTNKFRFEKNQGVLRGYYSSSEDIGGSAFTNYYFVPITKINNFNPGPRPEDEDQWFADDNGKFKVFEESVTIKIHTSSDNPQGPGRGTEENPITVNYENYRNVSNNAGSSWKKFYFTAIYNKYNSANSQFENEDITGTIYGNGEGIDYFDWRSEDFESLSEVFDGVYQSIIAIDQSDNTKYYIDHQYTVNEAYWDSEIPIRVAINLGCNFGEEGNTHRYTKEIVFYLLKEQQPQ